MKKRPRIEFASTDAVTEYAVEIATIKDAIRVAMRIKGILVTDESAISDFGMNAEQLQAFEEKLGMKLDLHDANDNFIVKLAARLRTGSGNRTLS